MRPCYVTIAPWDGKQLRLTIFRTLSAESALTSPEIHHGKAAITGHENIFGTGRHALTAARAAIGKGSWIYKPRWASFLSIRGSA
jgi:hypothetical protein